MREGVETARNVLEMERSCKRRETAMKIGTAIGTAQIVGTEFSNDVNQIHMKI